MLVDSVKTGLLVANAIETRRSCMSTVAKAASFVEIQGVGGVLFGV